MLFVAVRDVTYFCSGYKRRSRAQSKRIKLHVLSVWLDSLSLVEPYVKYTSAFSLKRRITEHWQSVGSWCF
jgi:hypothetical protein